MAKQLLIYENAVPVNKDRHHDWSVKAETDAGFASEINSAPLIAVEIPNVAEDCAVVFSGDDEIVPTVVLGIEAGKNLYLNDDGHWDTRYIPAFIRRYPFVFSSTDEGQTLTLCIDESFPGCNQEGRGERLFDADGEQTQYLKNVLTFLQEYQANFTRTQAFCRKLNELELLEPMTAQFRLPGGQETSLGGFMAVNRERLKGLSGDQLAELAKSDELELIYAHLQSLRKLSRLAERAGSEPPSGLDQGIGVETS